MKIVQLTDTHLLGDNTNLFGTNPKYVLKEALKSIQKNHSDAEFLVITGDLVHSGRHESYLMLKELLDSIDIPIRLILGNHDIKNQFNKVFDICEKDEFVQYEEIFENEIFLFLDTVIEGKEYGNLCEKRLAWLEKKLEKYKNKDVYIFMHHFPLDSNLPWMEQNAYFDDKENFWKVILKHSNVKHIFAGHLHRIINANFMGVGVSCTRSTTFQVAFTPNSQKDFLTNEEKPCYDVINIHKESIITHNHEFLDEHKVYIPHEY